MAASSLSSTISPTGKKRRMYILVGLPGSGKSYFASLLNAKNFIVISQDKLRLSYDRLLQRLRDTVGATRQHIVVDSCNHTPERRGDLTRLALERKLQVVIVEFQTPNERCLAQSAARINAGIPHPSIHTVAKAKEVFAEFLTKYSPVDEETEVKLYKEWNLLWVTIKTTAEASTKASEFNFAA